MAFTTATSRMPAAASARRKFPLELAVGVFLDVFASENDLLQCPGDETKTAALEAAKARLVVVVAEISAADSVGITAGVGGLFEAVWGHLGKQLSCPITQPAVWGASVCLETLCAMFDAACAASAAAGDELRRGGFLVAHAVLGVGTGSDVTPDTLPRLVTLLEAWGDEVCTKRFRVSDAWSTCYFDGKLWSPIHAVAISGFADLVPLAIRKGCSVNGDLSGRCESCPGAIAMKHGNHNVFEALMARDLDLVTAYERDGWPLGLWIFSKKESDPAFVSDVLRRRPEIINARTALRARKTNNLLGAAVSSRNAAILDVVLEAGIPREALCASDGSTVRLWAILGDALIIGDPTILELLITKFKILEDWESRYDDMARAYVSGFLARLAVSAYRPSPLYKGDSNHLVKHNPDAAACLELVFGTGLVCTWDFYGLNSLLQTLYPYENGRITGCVIEQAGALVLLKRFLAAGFDVRHRHSPTSPKGVRKGYELQHLSAHTDHLLVLDWAIRVLGAPAEPSVEENTDAVYSPLTLALNNHSIACALMLLDKCKVRAAYPEGLLRQQPVVAFMAVLHRYTDAEARDMLCKLVDAFPGLFDLPCFNEVSVAEEETKMSEASTSVAWNPVFMLVAPPKPETLELLLSKKLPGVAEIATRPVLKRETSNGATNQARVTAAQYAAAQNEWRCLSLILRYTNARVTDTFDAIPNVAQLVKWANVTNAALPRTLLATVEGRAKQEMASKNKKAPAASTAAALTGASAPVAGSSAAAVTGASAGGSASNAPEDPSLRVLTERELKQKAKKKAAKKKARAKKRAAASGGAGGAGDGAADSSDDDDDDDGLAEEEPDDNLVDSRNAPSLDLMLAQMGISLSAASDASDKKDGTA